MAFHNIIKREQMSAIGYGEFFFSQLELYLQRRDEDKKIHLNEEEMKSWMIIATLGPKIYNMIREALNGPCLSAAREHLTAYKREIGLDSSFFGESFCPNK